MDKEVRRRRRSKRRTQNRTNNRVERRRKVSPPRYAPEESEADYDFIPSPPEHPIYPPIPQTNGNFIVRWVNTHVDNVRLGLGVLIFICSLLILNNNLNVKDAYITSSQSLYNVLLMGKSTGDLTMWAREYVITGNDKYKKAYEDHLIVRAGEDYDDNGIKKSYDQRFKDIPTTIVPESDKQKLLDSLSTSDLLAVKETQAIKLAESGDRDKAIALLFSEDYETEKEKIVTPLIEFTRKMQLDVGKKVVTKIYFSYGFIIILCIANLILIFLINDRLDFHIRDDK